MSALDDIRTLFAEGFDQKPQLLISRLREILGLVDAPPNPANAAVEGNDPEPEPEPEAEEAPPKRKSSRRRRE